MATHRPIPPLSAKMIDRYWSKVERTGQADCWPWLGYTDADGYGGFHLGSRCTLRAPRVAYYLDTGVDPGDKEVLHTCDNPPCCNPAHLFTGTNLDNIRDRVDKGRTARQRGLGNPFAKYTGEQVDAWRREYSEGETISGLERRHELPVGTLNPIIRNRTRLDRPPTPPDVPGAAERRRVLRAERRRALREVRHA